MGFILPIVFWKEGTLVTVGQDLDMLFEIIFAEKAA
jgi:hypothetical protein